MKALIAWGMTMCQIDNIDITFQTYLETQWVDALLIVDIINIGQNPFNWKWAESPPVHVPIAAEITVAGVHME